MRSEEEKTMMELAEKVGNVWDDYEFILGILSYTMHPDDRQKMIAFIDSGINVSVETICNCAMNLYDKRRNNGTKR